MRILHVISGIEPENGGPTAALVGHCRAMAAAGVTSSIVATWKSKTSFALAESLRAEGIAVTLIGPTRRPFRSHRLIDPTLTAEIARHDVVHVHAVWEWIEHRAAVLARRAGKPYVWTPHGMLDEWNMRRNGLFKRVCMAAYLRRDLRRAAAIHVATDFEQAQVGRLKLGTAFFVKGFGLDRATLDAEPLRAMFRDRIGVAADLPLVLFLGRIQRGKGLETLVPAMAALKHRDARLVIAGPDEGGYRQQIEALAAGHAMTNRVTFVGMIAGDEKRQALAAADVLAAPSAHESFGLAVAEAIAVGTAVVVSDQVGLAGEIRRNDLGRVAPIDVNATAAAIDNLLDAAVSPNASERTARHHRARAFARDHFDWPVIAEAWRERYATLRVSSNL